MIQIDIPMPENCSDCPCMYDCIVCQAAERHLDVITFTEKRPEWCPLQEVKQDESLEDYQFDYDEKQHSGLLEE